MATEEEVCFFCNETRRCPVCNGIGIFKARPCPSCNESGVCPHCLPDSIAAPDHEQLKQDYLALSRSYTALSEQTEQQRNEFLKCIGLLENTIAALIEERDFYKEVADMNANNRLKNAILSILASK